jgi:thymidylate synthase (FAD)
MNRGTEVKVLNHGYLRLVDWMGSDESIIEAARMSTGKGFLGWDGPCEIRGPSGEVCKATREEVEAFRPHPINPSGKHLCWGGRPHAFGDEKLLRFLYENRHDTPFEMAELLVEVQAPIMVFREWHRHRTQSYNEMSARYIQMPNLHYIPNVNRIIAASKKHRNKQQGGGGELKPPPRLGPEERVPQTEVEIAGWVYDRLAKEQQTIYDLYEVLLGMGLAPEVARIDTPVARYSRMRAKTDLRNWLAFLTLRSDEAAQWEIRQYAYALGYFISRLFPRTWDLWLNVDRKWPRIDKNGFILPETA